MLVQRREWDAGMDPDTATKRGFNPRDFDLGHNLRLVDGEHDVFGDGSVVCLRIPEEVARESAMMSPTIPI